MDSFSCLDTAPVCGDVGQVEEFDGNVVRFSGLGQRRGSMRGNVECRVGLRSP